MAPSWPSSARRLSKSNPLSPHPPFLSAPLALTLGLRMSPPPPFVGARTARVRALREASLAVVQEAEDRAQPAASAAAPCQVRSWMPFFENGPTAHPGSRAGALACRLPPHSLCVRRNSEPLPHVPGNGLRAACHDPRLFDEWTAEAPGPSMLMRLMRLGSSLIHVLDPPDQEGDAVATGKPLTLPFAPGKSPGVALRLPPWKTQRRSLAPTPAFSPLVSPLGRREGCELPGKSPRGTAGKDPRMRPLNIERTLPLPPLPLTSSLSPGPAAPACSSLASLCDPLQRRGRLFSLCG